MQDAKYLNQGECGLVIEFGAGIDPLVNKRVHQLARRIQLQFSPFVEAVVPTYRSLLILFDPLRISRGDLVSKIEKLSTEREADSSVVRTGAVITIPTCYGGEFGPDLEFVARHNNIGAEEVIRIHTSTAYQIYMMGFTPGFPYLGGMSEKIAAPRLEKPRTSIPAGSVGIAGTQTGLYPVESPGGWQLIGRTPLKVFNPASGSPFLYSAGDFLQFEAVSASDYEKIRADVVRDNFMPQILTEKGASA